MGVVDVKFLSLWSLYASGETRDKRGTLQIMMSGTKKNYMVG